MNLSVDNIQYEIKQIGKLRNIHKEPRFLEFIARKCIEVLKEETEAARGKSPYGNISKEYAESHTYETFISGLSSIVVLSNEAKNQFGEYISRYIEYGTGMYNAESTAPNGWIYPTDETDKNTTKRQTRNGELLAFTKGQSAKLIYANALDRIKDNLDGWINEYISREVKLW